MNHLTYSNVEGVAVNILLWLLPVAFSMIPIVSAFKSRHHLSTWIKFWPDIPRVVGTVPGLSFLVLSVLFGVSAGVSVFLLRKGESFGDLVGPLIINYLSMFLVSMWTLPLLMFWSRNFTSLLLIAANLSFLAFTILTWVYGPWYAGLVASIAYVFLIMVSLLWLIPMSADFVPTMLGRSKNGARSQR